MAVPAAAAIRKKYPDSFIAWAVDARCAAVVDTERLVDLRYEVPREDWKAKGISWLKQYRHFARLRRFKFDYGIDLQGHSKTALCLRIAQPKVRIASRCTDLMARLANPIAPQIPNHEHVVERNIDTLRQLDSFPEEYQWIMPNVSRCSAELKQQVANPERLITISVSAGHPLKEYSRSGWGKVAEKLMGQGYTVAFLGGPSDTAPAAPGSIDWVGKLSLRQAIAAVSISQAHLAADTGGGHIAAALGVPVLSVFGYTKQSEYRPYTKNGVVLDAGPSMDKVNPEEIVREAEALVNRQVYALSH
jgi:ADP-heptose:LPS heptosyltransferase